MVVSPFTCLLAPFFCMGVIFLIDKISRWYYGDQYSASGLNPERYPPENSTDADGFINSSMYLSMDDD